MNSKDQAFLEQFCVKESCSLTGQENFGATGLSIKAWSFEFYFKKSLKFKTTKWVNFYRESLKIFYLWCTFLKELTTYDHESLLQAESIQSPSLKFGCSLSHNVGGNVPRSYWPDSNGKHSDPGYYATWNHCINSFFWSKSIHMQKTDIIAQSSLEMQALM